MYKAEQVDGDRDILRERLLEVKAYAMAGILPNSFETLGTKWNAVPIHTEIMAIASPSEADQSQFEWQQLHCDSMLREPYSILCAVTPGYYYDMLTKDESGNDVRLRQKLNTGEMSVIRGNLPHAGGPTTAYRLHMTAKFEETQVCCAFSLWE